MSAGMSPLIAPVSSVHQRSRSTDLAGSSSGRSRRIKTQQPTLVIMPDGHSLCFALKESIPARNDPSSSSSKPDEHIESSSPAHVEANGVVGMSSNQRVVLPHRSNSTRTEEYSNESSHQTPTNGLHATLSGSTQAGSS